MCDAMHWAVGSSYVRDTGALTVPLDVSPKVKPAQTLDEILDQMTRYNVLPKLINVTAEAGAPPIMPPDYVHREIVKGQLAPLGRFRGPLVTHTNYSTLHLYRPGLDAFADWQVQPAQ